MEGKQTLRSMPELALKVLIISGGKTWWVCLFIFLKEKTLVLTIYAV